MMGAFVPLAIILPTSYFINDLKITDKKVFVRKAISGRLVVMSFEDIRAFQCLKVTSRGINFYYIRFFLKNGKKIKSGNLYIKPNSLYNLCNILYSKVGMEVNTRKEIKGLKQDNECSCNVSVFRNFILPVLCLGPFIISILMLLLFVSNANQKLGEQKSIEVSGVVTERYLGYSSKSKTTSYDFVIRDINSNQEYRLDVNSDIYNMFNENDGVLIKAEKGSLGIVYDQWFYKNADE